MKSLESMSNLTKLGMLYDMFPKEVRAMMDTIIDVCDEIDKKKEGLIKEWNNFFISSQEWIGIAAQIKANIDTAAYKRKLPKNSWLAYDTGDFFLALVTIHALNQHQTDNKKLKLCIQLFFEI